ncbi:cysteine proteinase [mine drainage metagenome]|uniref:Cysteine proteinase n=1 Tax=mine drainage metagenome TaxID=410659 RepID=T1BXK2_9ZZZZ
MKRSTRLIAFAMLLVVFLGGRWLWQYAGTSSATVTVPRIDRIGQLTFTPCTLHQFGSGLSTRAWCAPFRVPENWAKPGGPEIALRLAMIRSPAAVPAPDPVLYLAGGPGQSAIDTWPALAPALAGVLPTRNVILLDQRGTGGSTPLTCPRYRAQPPVDGTARESSAAGHGAHLAALMAQTQACLAALRKRGLNPADFTTTQAVLDLVALRRALGDPEFDLVGVSYGTRVAQQFVMQDPHAVRSMVLDSVVPDQLILGQSFGVNLDNALHADFALCTKNPLCHHAFGNPWDTLVQLKRHLARHPIRVHFRTARNSRPAQEMLTPARLVALVRLDAYSPLTAALLPLALHAAAEGHDAPLLAESRWISRSAARTMNGAMQLSVVCSEDVPWLHATPAEAASLLGDHVIDDLRAMCAIWPKGAVPARFHTPLQSKVPTLILEGQFDPVTPPRYGVDVLKGLGDARLLIAPGQAHNVIGAGCMPHLVTRFIRHPDPALIHAGCLSQLKPVPPFLNYNRGAP